MIMILAASADPIYVILTNPLMDTRNSCARPWILIYFDQ